MPPLSRNIGSLFLAILSQFIAGADTGIPPHHDGLLSIKPQKEFEINIFDTLCARKVSLRNDSD